VVPAGVGHCLLEDLNGGFEMVGSYPKGRNWDMCYGKEEEGKKSRESVDWAGLRKIPYTRTVDQS